MQVVKTFYNDAQMTDSNSLSAALMEKPTELSPIITHLAGKEDRKFPLTMLTEGVGNTKSIDRWEYEYRVKTHEINVRPLVAAATTPDSGGMPFKLTFPDKWFVFPYTLISESGAQVRIMSEPVQEGNNYVYTVQQMSPSSTNQVAAGDIAAGALWGQLYANVGLDFSRGNASNWSAPGLVRNKIGTVRKSYHFAGNAKDYVAEFNLPTKGGKQTKLWMDYEEYRHMLRFKEECELMYWYGEKTYGDDGNVMMTDENGQPVITGPGLLQQIINKTSYSTLTESKLLNTIGDMFYGMTDATDKVITLYTGIGGAREFDSALKGYTGGYTSAAAGPLWTVNADSKFITGSGRSLGMTGYFTSYDHIDGYRVNVVKNPMFDHGPVAQARAKHPTTGYSLESYRMVFVDNSNYDGQNNVQMINKKGREMLRWCVAGSVVPRGFDSNGSRASDIDGASVHMLKTAGVVLRRFDTSLDMECVAT
jgi:hypothetical protein